MRSATARARAAKVAFALLAVAICGATTAAATFQTGITRSDIARAIALGRSPGSSALQRFHDGYVIRLGDQLLDRLEIVTEFRRVVLATEDRARLSDIEWGPAQAAAMLQPWRNRVSLLLHVTFPPANTYRAMPRFRVVLYGRPESGGPRRIEPVDLVETPRYISGQPAPPGTPILAGLVDATFSAEGLDPNGVYLAGIEMEGRELRRVEVDFGRVQ